MGKCSKKGSARILQCSSFLFWCTFFGLDVRVDVLRLYYMLITIHIHFESEKYSFFKAEGV